MAGRSVPGSGDIVQALNDPDPSAGRLSAREETLSWLSTLYEAVDDQDLDAFVEHFAPDATLRFANADPAQGLEEIRHAIGGFFEDLEGLEHRPRNVVERSGAVVFEASVTYDLPDGREVTVPAVTVIERTGRTVDAMRIYVDLAPLHG